MVNTTTLTEIDTDQPTRFISARPQATPKITPVKKENKIKRHERQPKETQGGLTAVGLTRKQKAWADYLIENPKASATEAVKHAYKITNPNTNTASGMAYENQRKPEIRKYLELHNQEAEETVLELMRMSKDFAKEGTRDGASYATVALNASKDIQDRVKGKATQKVEQQSVGIMVTVDLSGDDERQHEHQHERQQG